MGRHTLNKGEYVMTKLAVIVAFGLVLFFGSTAHAWSTFKLSGLPGENTVDSFGYNDYVPENAFKNNLQEQGYTVCFDSKPAGLDVTPVTYMGRLADPSSQDVDYVLTSEYKALNAAEQDKRITTNNQISTVNRQAIHNVDRKTSFNKMMIDNNTRMIQNVTNQINRANSRLDALEATQYKATLELRLHDAKRFTVSAYGEYNIERGRADEFGVKVTLKLTKSYEEKRLDELEAKIKRLERRY